MISRSAVSNPQDCFEVILHIISWQDIWCNIFTLILTMHYLLKVTSFNCKTKNKFSKLLICTYSIRVMYPSPLTGESAKCKFSFFPD